MSGKRPHRPRRNRVDTDVVGTEVDGEVAHARLERRLGDAHDVVMRHHTLGAGKGKCKKTAAAIHQRGRAFGDGGKGKARDIQGPDEVLPRRIDVSAREFLFVGIGDCVNDKIQIAPFFIQGGEDDGDARFILDVAGEHDGGAERFGKRLHALAEDLSLIGEGQFGAVPAQGLGDPPRDGMVVGNPHDEAFFAGHQCIRIGHPDIIGK